MLPSSSISSLALFAHGARTCVLIMPRCSFANRPAVRWITGGGGGGGGFGGGGGGGGGMRPGDWMCGSCGAHNFASRLQCFKCQGPKTEGGDGGGGGGGGGGFGGDQGRGGQGW